MSRSSGLLSAVGRGRVAPAGRWLAVGLAIVAAGCSSKKKGGAGGFEVEPATSAAARPAAPPVSTPMSVPARAVGTPAAAQAEGNVRACLAEATCDEAELGRRLVEAEAQGARVCAFFRYAIGVPLDLARARTCYEARVPQAMSARDPDSNIERFELALMRASAAGGSRDINGADRLLATDEKDVGTKQIRVTLEGLRQQASPDPEPAICETNNLGTADALACGRVDELRGEVEEWRFLRDRQAQGPAALTATLNARRLFKAYREAASAKASDDFRDGAVAGLAGLRADARLRKLRRDRLDTFGAYKPTIDTAEAARRVTVLTNQEGQALEDAKDAKSKAAASKTAAAYRAWRAAEIAMYGAAFPQASKVDLPRDVGALLDAERGVFLEEERP